MIDKMKKFINIRDIFIDLIKEINIGVIDILHLFSFKTPILYENS
jgi:hypothetical protein